jgi:hypothetical protein
VSPGVAVSWATATPNQHVGGTSLVDAGEDASGIQKTFDVREDFVGQVVTFDGDAYVIDFKKTPRSTGVVAK